MYQPIYRPPLPLVHRVPGDTLQPEMMIKISGLVVPGSLQFAINLQTGASTLDDVALHLSPVFINPQRVIRNSTQTLVWGMEESYGGNPVRKSGPEPGQYFEIVILVDYDRYNIAINGYHFAEFQHKIPFYRVTHLLIDGDVYINYLVYEKLTRTQLPQYQRSTNNLLVEYI